ncbi:hypothetical protein D030_3874A, partial [Vibrio parahaemolyticus AQ3810]
MRQPFLVQ